MEAVGVFYIADMPNSYFYVKCENIEMLKMVIFKGPWTVSGMVFQLSHWEEMLQLAMAKLNKAAIWLQLHHLPLDFWDVETLESMIENIGHLLKIDELTLERRRAKYTRVCLEIDLSQPLKCGFWVGYQDRRAFMAILYKRLPIFCYSCGMIGQTVGACNRRFGDPMGRGVPPSDLLREIV